MQALKVKNREFQRAAGKWLEKAKLGNTIIIVSTEGPPLTLKAGAVSAGPEIDWDEHFAWLKKQPLMKANPMDALREMDGR